MDLGERNRQLEGKALTSSRGIVRRLTFAEAVRPPAYPVSIALVVLRGLGAVLVVLGIADMGLVAVPAVFAAPVAVAGVGAASAAQPSVLRRLVAVSVVVLCSRRVLVDTTDAVSSVHSNLGAMPAVVAPRLTIVPAASVPAVPVRHIEPCPGTDDPYHFRPLYVLSCYLNHYRYCHSRGRGRGAAVDDPHPEVEPAQFQTPAVRFDQFGLGFGWRAKLKALSELDPLCVTEGCSWVEVYALDDRRLACRACKRVSLWHERRADGARTYSSYSSRIGIVLVFFGCSNQCDVKSAILQSVNKLMFSRWRGQMTAPQAHEQQTMQCCDMSLA